MGLELVAAILLIALAAALGLFAGSRHWRKATNMSVARLIAARQAHAVTRYRESELVNLPVPVSRYFRAVLRDGQPMITSAVISHEGQFQTGTTDATWRPFRSIQTYAVNPPGFVWDARIRMAPGIAVRVRDAYLGGAGSMRAAALGVFTVVNAHDTRELAAGALQRHLAELVWLPTALLPSQGTRWTPINDSSARAALTNGSTTVSLDFHFNADGECTGVYAPARFREAARSATGRPSAARSARAPRGRRWPRPDAPGRRQRGTGKGKRTESARFTTRRGTQVDWSVRTCQVPFRERNACAGSRFSGPASSRPPRAGRAGPASPPPVRCAR